MYSLVMAQNDRSGLRRRNYLKALGASAGAAGIGASGTALGESLDSALGRAAGTATLDPNDPGILEPVNTKIDGVETRIPNTNQVENGELQNQVSFSQRDAEGATSLTGHRISHVENPHEDLDEALADLDQASMDGDTAAMESEAREIMDILKGDTQGRVYDGFSMLNFNQGGPLPDQVDGEHKMKRLRDSGETAESMDDEQHTVWEVDVNMFWYGGQFDADTYLLRIPIEAGGLDLLRINYRIYSLESEHFAPMTVTLDDKAFVQLPFKGFDSVWTSIDNDAVAEITVDHPPLGLFGGVYTWGWREHPPRIQFLQPVGELRNAHTGEVELDPLGRSFAQRTRNLTIDDVGAAAPERKMYEVAKAVLDGTATASEVNAMLTDPDTDPRGTWDEWVDFASDQTQLLPEARDVLAAEGIDDGKFGDYDYVVAYANNEMYGDGPDGADVVADWGQGDTTKVKVINLDDRTHYYRVIDFGPRLHDDIANNRSAGGHSFEIHNLKPSYGVHKVVELMWRTNYGFRPTFDVITQYDTFSRDVDRTDVTPFEDGAGNQHVGYQYSAGNRVGDWRFDPPPALIGQTSGDGPSSQRLKEADGTDGVVIGTLTEGYGDAKICSNATIDPSKPCPQDLSQYHPLNLKNTDTDGDGEADELRFPGLLRNPDADGGDLVLPDDQFFPFLTLSPHNGTIFVDPDDPSKGHWVDETQFHGRPVFAGDDITANIEQPRAGGQVLYQVDALLHNSNIFTPHPGGND